MKKNKPYNFKEKHLRNCKKILMTCKLNFHYKSKNQTMNYDNTNKKIKK